MNQGAKSGHKAKVIMIQGTMSSAGKSAIAAGLCRIFSDDGYKVAPFKSQNMALNSYITSDGLEMGRAQVMQAECARISPMSIMNPILLKPTKDMSSQVVVNGVPYANMSASEYFKHKKDFIADIKKAYDELAEFVDIIVVEGAGSPVELNLKKDDIVNMGLARMLDAPVLLVGDIDRGGIFAQLLGTLDLLTDSERDRVKGLIINKFRGDITLFDDGIKILEERGNTKVVGVVPYLNVKLDDEDSLTDRFDRKGSEEFDIAVIRLKHISNFTDFDTFDQLAGVSLRYVSTQEELGNPDIIIIPGSKNTIEDLRLIKDNKLADLIVSKSREGTCIIGICGGFQMLGRRIKDPLGVECGGSEEGLCLLPIDTTLGKEKVRSRFEGTVSDSTGVLSGLKGKPVSGYEIHMGETMCYGEASLFTSDNTGYCLGNVYGSYVHGFFDKRDIMLEVVRSIARTKGKDITLEALDYSEFKEKQYDLIAKGLRESLDMDYIYKLLGVKE